jgi:Zn-dependent protease
VLFNLIPLPPFDGYNALEPFLNPIIRDQVDRMRGATMWIIFLLFWYVPFISKGFWQVVYIFATFLGANWRLVALGLERFQFWRL